MDQITEKKDKDHQQDVRKDLTDFVLSGAMAREGCNARLGRLLKEAGSAQELIKVLRQEELPERYAFLKRTKQDEAFFSMLKEFAQNCGKNRSDLTAPGREVLENCARYGIGLVFLTDPEYPPMIRQILDPPAVLFYRGDIKKATAEGIAVVGSRKAGEYGKRAAYEIAAAISSLKVPVVSGLAFGIDRSAHTGTIDHQGIPIAVLPTGLDVCYPKAHQWLLGKVESMGLSLSEYPPKAAFLKAHFVERNRLISGLSSATVIVQAGAKSGSVITAQYAADQGRDVFVVPGSLFDASFIGSHHLIRDGANILTSIQEILRYAGADRQHQLMLMEETKTQPRIGHRVAYTRTQKSWIEADQETKQLIDEEAGKRDRAGQELWLYSLLDDFGQSVSELSNLSQKPVEMVQQAVTMLEIKDLARHLGPLIVKK